MKKWFRARLLLPALFGLAIVVVLGLVIAAQSGSPAPSGPRPATAYYQVTEATENVLYALTLDGLSAPKRLAARATDRRSTIEWEVDANGATALALSSGPAGTTIEGIDLATGAARWTSHADVPAADGVWSADGHQWAMLSPSLAQGFSGPLTVVIVDTASGAVRSLVVPDLSWPQGFTPSGDLVIVTAGDDSNPRNFGFQLVDHGTGVAHVVTLVDAGTAPHSQWGLDLGTALRLAVRIHGSEDDATGKTTAGIELTDLQTGATSQLGRLDDAEYTWVALQPDGTGVLAMASVGEDPSAPDGRKAALGLLDMQGGGRDLWMGPMPERIATSANGQLVGLSGSRRTAPLVIVDVRVARTIDLPLPERYVDARIVALREGAVLADLGRASASPGSSATASAQPTPTPQIVAGPRLVSASVDSAPDGSWVMNVEVLAPSAGGRAIVTDRMPSISTPPTGDDDRPNVQVVPRPGSDEILVVLSSPGPTRAWLWVPGSDPVDAPLPDTMPVRYFNVAWRPDGKAIAAEVAAGGVAIADLGGGTVRQIPWDSEYTMLAGWTADGRRLVLGHGVCTEGCPGRYADLAVLDPRTSRVTPVDPKHADIGYAAFAVQGVEGQRDLVLSAVENTSGDDIRVPWPAALPPLSNGFVSQSVSAGRRLFVAVDGDEDDQTIYRVDDPLRRVRDGVSAAQPALVGRLPRGLSMQWITEDGAWVIASDRTQLTYLVHLGSDAQSWIVDAQGDVSWASAGPSPDTQPE